MSGYSTRWQAFQVCFFGAVVALPVIYIFGARCHKGGRQTPACPETNKDTPEPCRDNGEDDGDLRSSLVALNDLAIAELKTNLQKTTPWADLGTMFQKWSQKYPFDRHKLVQARSRKSQTCKCSF